MLFKHYLKCRPVKVKQAHLYAKTEPTKLTPKTSKQGSLEFYSSLLTRVPCDKWGSAKRSRCFFGDNNKMGYRKPPRPGAGAHCSRAAVLRCDTASPLQGDTGGSCKLAVIASGNLDPVWCIFEPGERLKSHCKKPMRKGLL